NQKASSGALQDTAAAIRAAIPDPSGFDATGVPDGYLLGVENETVVAVEVENIPPVAGQAGRILSNDGSALEWVENTGGGEGSDVTFGCVEADEFYAEKTYTTRRGRALVLVDSLSSADVRSRLGVGEMAKIVGVDSLALRLSGTRVLRIAFDVHGQADTTPPTITNFACAQVGADVHCSWDSDETLVLVDGDHDGPGID